MWARQIKRIKRSHSDHGVWNRKECEIDRKGEVKVLDKEKGRVFIVGM